MGRSRFGYRDLASRKGKRLITSAGKRRTGDQAPVDWQFVIYMLHFAVIEVRQTEVFSKWLRKLRDQQARGRIADRLLRVQGGNLGDAKTVGGGVSELRIDYGPGYRVYFVQRGPVVIVLLCGGDKRTQAADIKRAKRMVRELE